MSAATAQGGLGRPAEGSQTNQCRINLSPIGRACGTVRFGLLARPVRGIFFAWPGLGRSQDLSSEGAGWWDGLKGTQRV